MDLKERTFRDGASRKDRDIAALDVNYVSVEERSVEDLLKFVLEFAGQLTFYDSSNQPQGDWKLFFGGDPVADHSHSKAGLTDAEKQYLTEVADYLDNPDRYANNPEKLALYSAPHRVLLSVYIKLLEYARQQFTDLTRRHLDHYYRDVLRLTEQPATPDQVNVVFELAGGETECLLKQGARLDGGKDGAGNPRYYSLDDDIVVNRAALARAYTLHVRRKVVDLQSVLNSDALPDSAVKSGGDFFNMLKWGLGYPGQGDNLPLYPNNELNDTTVSVTELNAVYNRIDGLDPAQVFASHPNDYTYVLDQLNFKHLEDFTCVMGLNKRQQDSNPYNNPDAEEWQQAYDYIEGAFLKRQAKSRQETLKTINADVSRGFIALMEYAFGQGTDNQLPFFTYAPQANTRQTLDTVSSLLRASAPGRNEYDDAKTYVNRQLYMSVDAFRYVMNTHDNVPDLDDAAWKNVYEIVERAQSARENYSPSLKRVQVQRLIPRLVFARGQVDFPGRFATFGETAQGLAEAGVDTEPCHLGFAVSSPLLLLKEGKRVINLSFTFSKRLDNGILKALTDGLAIEFSGGAGLPWFSAEREDIASVFSFLDRTLTLTITLEASAPPMLAPVAGATGFTPVQPVTSPHPLIRLSVKDIIEDGGSGNNLYYDRLRDLQLQRLGLTVSVGEGIGAGIQRLALRNDDNVLNSNGAMAPFGQNPYHLAGYYLANDEICRKRLTGITFYLEWINLPDSFSSASGYYQGYKNINGDAIPVDDADFSAELKVFNNRMLDSIGTEDLFNLVPPDYDTLNSVSSLSYNLSSFSSDYTGIALADTGSNDPFEWDRYFKLELSGANSTFLQDAYPVALQNLEPGDKINRPYVPKLRRVSVDYSCAGTFDFTGVAQATDPIQVLQIHPFGQVDVLKTDLLTDANGAPVGYHLLPQYRENGHLYLGVQELQDGQDLSLLFQMDSGSENSGLEPPPLDWNYLSNDNWIKFRDEEVLSDTTEGMLDTGIVRFHPPSSLEATESHPRATASNTLLQNGLHWFEARVADRTSAFPAGIAVTAQAASATYLLQSPASAHLNEVLPAHTITKLLARVPAIDSVKQPYSSSGGNGQEDNAGFIRRVSERLRHKQRAVSVWDYERLVLEQFPDIYKVKCLSQGAQENEPAAAKVKLVVIPNLVNRTPFFPLKPKVPQKLRRQIVDYLEDKVSPFVDFEVANPRYEEIRYRVTLKFKHRESEGFYLRKLNRDMISYLSPWAYDNQADISFGGSIHLSSLIHFITDLPYVEFVGNVELIDHLLISQDSEGATGERELTPLVQKVVEPRFPDSILVSSPDHFIDLVTGEFKAIHFYGIGYMAIGVDFITA